MATSGVDMGKDLDLKGLKVANSSKGLLRRAWSRDIALESLMSDSYMAFPALTGVIKSASDGKFVTVPGKIIQKVTADGANAARSVTLQYTKALSASGYEGTSVDSTMGNEETVSMLYCNAYSGDWGKGVTGQQFGVAYREKKETGVFQLVKPLLAQWYGEQVGKYKREALCQSVSHNIVAAGIGIDQMINSNTYTVGNTVPFTTLKSYNTYALYLAALLTKLGNIDATDTLTVTALLNLVSAAKKSYIKPIKWEGYELYVLMINDDSFMNMFDPTNTNGISKYYIEAASLGSGNLNDVIPGANFVISNSIVVCSDLRAPQAKVDTGDVAFSYVNPGRADQRTALSGAFWNVGILLGENALLELETEKPHFEIQKDIYGKYLNTAYFGATGYQTPLWVNDDVTTAAGHSKPTAGAANTRQESSMLVFYAANGATYT
jgi:hypothetical protein